MNMEKKKSCCAGSRSDVNQDKPVDVKEQAIKDQSDIMYQDKMVHIPGADFQMEKKKSCCAGSRSDVNQDKTVEVKEQAIKEQSDIMYQDKMVHIPGGDFLMGTSDKEGFPADGEGPIRKIKVDPFLMDATAVTN